MRLREQLNLLYEQLRESSDSERRQELVSSAIRQGISLVVIQQMLDQLEQLEQMEQARAVPAPKFRGWHRLQAYCRKLYQRTPPHDRHN